MPYNPFFEQRATEAASYVLSKFGGRMNYMKLIKLLYLADRKAFENWEHPITYDTYSSLPRGPVLSSTLDLVKSKCIDSDYWDYFIEKKGMDIELKESAIFKKLSPVDLEIIDSILSEFGHLSQFDLAEITEKLPEWKNPGASSFPIELHDLLEKLNYSSDDIERIILDIKEKYTLDLVFSK
ncbi:MAG: Panacea domain-containing protein [Anaerolineaceae bacterium]